MISGKKVIIVAVGVVVIPVIIIALIIAVCFVDRHIYLNSYHDIELEQVMRIEDSQIIHGNYNIPYWYSYEKPETIKLIENKYNVSFGDIDENEMLIISYGAELLSFDYNSREDSFRTRRHYIGYPFFGEFEPYTAYVYKTNKIPLFSAEVGGFSYDYMGQYRDYGQMWRLSDK